MTIVLITRAKTALSQYFQLRDDWFDEQIYLDSPNIKLALSLLRQRQIDYVLNGDEHSTYFSDLLGQHLTPHLANNTDTSVRRADKFTMQETLKMHGLPYIKQIKTTPDKLLHKIYAEGNLIIFPAFLKPNKGYASINAFKIDNLEHLHERIKFLQLIGEASNEYLFQEMVVGVERVIDSFSAHGKHYLSAVFKYNRAQYKGYHLYRYVEVENDPNIWYRANEFVNSILDALDVQNGITHNEVMFMDDGQIKLIELNNRTSGAKGSFSDISQLCKLQSQSDLLANFLIHGVCKSSDIKHKIGFARALILYKFTDTPIQDPLQQLTHVSSFVKLIMLKEVGSIPSLDSWSLVDACAIIVLFNLDEVQLEKESCYIFSLEKNGTLL